MWTPSSARVERGGVLDVAHARPRWSARRAPRAAPAGASSAAGAGRRRSRRASRRPPTYPVAPVSRIRGAPGEGVAGSSARGIPPRLTSRGLRVAGDREVGCGSRWWGRGSRGSRRRGSCGPAATRPSCSRRAAASGGRLAARRAEGAVLDHGSPAIAAPPGTALRAAGRHAARRRPRRRRGRHRLPVGRHAPAEAHGRGARRRPRRAAGGAARGRRRPRARRRAGQHPRDRRRRGGDRPGAPGGRPAGAQPRARRARGVAALARLRARRHGPRRRCASTGSRHWTAARPDAGPLGEVRREGAKGRGRPTASRPSSRGSTPAASAELLDASDEAVLDRALPALAELARAGRRRARLGTGQALALRRAAGAPRRRGGQPRRLADRRRRRQR